LVQAARYEPVKREVRLKSKPVLIVIKLPKRGRESKKLLTQKLLGCPQIITTGEIKLII
jgi:hypothetical protein